MPRDAPVTSATRPSRLNRESLMRVSSGLVPAACHRFRRAGQHGAEAAEGGEGGILRLAEHEAVIDLLHDHRQAEQAVDVVEIEALRGKPAARAIVVDEGPP